MNINNKYDPLILKGFFQAACKDDGGKLVEINSPGENAFLADWLTSLLGTYIIKVSEYKHVTFQPLSK